MINKINQYSHICLISKLKYIGVSLFTPSVFLIQGKHGLVFIVRGDTRVYGKWTSLAPESFWNMYCDNH